MFRSRSSGPDTQCPEFHFIAPEDPRDPVAFQGGRLEPRKRRRDGFPVLAQPPDETGLVHMQPVDANGLDQPARDALDAPLDGCPRESELSGDGLVCRAMEDRLMWAPA
jgi:hypothetical protein